MTKKHNSERTEIRKQQPEIPKTPFLKELGADLAKLCLIIVIVSAVAVLVWSY
jgi:hypothetical protein